MTYLIFSLLLPIVTIYLTLAFLNWQRTRVFLTPIKFLGVFFSWNDIYGQSYRQMRQEAKEEELRNSFYRMHDTNEWGKKEPKEDYQIAMAYAILGVPPFSSLEVCEKAYRFLALYYHPDNQVTGNKQKMQQLNGAIKCIRERNRYER